MNEPPGGTLGTEVYTLESQAEEARRIIDAYRKGRCGLGRGAAE